MPYAFTSLLLQIVSDRTRLPHHNHSKAWSYWSCWKPLREVTKFRSGVIYWRYLTPKGKVHQTWPTPSKLGPQHIPMTNLSRAPFRCEADLIRQGISQKLCKALKISGPFNIQFICKDPWQTRAAADLLTLISTSQRWSCYLDCAYMPFLEQMLRQSYKR